MGEDKYVTKVSKPERRWSALALIVTAQFMVILDVAIVNVALPSIKSDLGFSQTNLQWVISAYAILFGGTLLLGGRIADLLGRRRLFVAGLALFATSSLLCGLAWSEGSLIAGNFTGPFFDSAKSRLLFPGWRAQRMEPPWRWCECTISEPPAIRNLAGSPR